MKILLFGKNGQVGWELHRALQPLGETVAPGREEADLSDAKGLENIVRHVRPDIIVNAAAYTAVDRAEEEEDLALEINAGAPSVLAQAAAAVNALLVHYSTDYVFDGTKGSPYIEADQPNPVNAYGRTKLAGEQAIQASGCDYLIFRTSWVYASRGHNFLLTILKLAKDREELRIVSDQTGSPTSARLIAETTSLCIMQSMKERESGIFSSDLYHLVAAENTSWHGFAEAIIDASVRMQNMTIRVKNLIGISSSDYPTPAKRPKNSRLDHRKLEDKFGVVMPDWKKSLLLCVEEIK